MINKGFLLKIVLAAQQRKQSLATKELATLFSVDVLLSFVDRRCTPLRITHHPTPKGRGKFFLFRTHPPAHAEGAWQALPFLEPIPQPFP
jgi:hypothetical protein